MIEHEERKKIVSNALYEVSKAKKTIESKDSSVLMITESTFSTECITKITTLIPFSSDKDAFISACEELVTIESEKAKYYRKNIPASRENEQLRQIESLLTKIVEKIMNLDSRMIEKLNTSIVDIHHEVECSGDTSDICKQIEKILMLKAALKLSHSSASGDRGTNALNLIPTIYLLWRKHGGPEVLPEARGAFLSLVVILLEEVGQPSENPSYLIDKALFN